MCVVCLPIFTIPLSAINLTLLSPVYSGSLAIKSDRFNVKYGRQNRTLNENLTNLTDSSPSCLQIVWTVRNGSMFNLVDKTHQLIKDTILSPGLGRPEFIVKWSCLCVNVVENCTTWILPLIVYLCMHNSFYHFEWWFSGWF